ncbi:hypothetical protein C0993_002283, partial [Termitomyces sp. T159_Od127]
NKEKMFSNFSNKNDDMSNDDLKLHAGGRLVTKREIVRSKKLMQTIVSDVGFLAQLFFKLEFAEEPAVTPSIDLAKLALVTSRDAEEDEADSKGSTDSSNDTDAALPGDAPLRVV